MWARLTAGIAGSNPTEGMDDRLLCLLCVSSVDGLIASSERSYRVRACLIVCDLGPTTVTRPSSESGCCAIGKEIRKSKEQ